MSQFNWIYLTDYGNRYNVGFYHNPKSGHFMAYCNNKIVVIDFHVFKTKKFSFFLDGELVELKVDKKNDTYSYGLETNLKVDTQHNKLMRAHEKANRKKGIIAIIAFVLVIASAILFFMRYF